MSCDEISMRDYRRCYHDSYASLQMTCVHLLTTVRRACTVLQRYHLRSSHINARALNKDERPPCGERSFWTK